MISIDKNALSDYTMVPNAFLDSYLCGAKGDDIKVYLYVLRKASDKSSAELSAICDALDLSEKCVLDALKHWEEEGILELFHSENHLAGIRFVSPSKAAKAKEKHRLTSERVRQLKKEDQEANQIIFLAESYFGRPLTISETADLLYFHDKLGFSADLCDYLLEYSITHGAKNMNYPKTVALAWHAEGIQTVEQAKAHSRLKSDKPEKRAAEKTGRRSRPGNAGKNQFLDFDQHEYDLKELARKAKE